MTITTYLIVIESNSFYPLNVNKSDQEPKNQLPLTLTERLAAERNSLANERTLLAYIRTALTLIVSGTGFANYLASPILRVIFLAFIPVGLLVLSIGGVRFWQQRKLLRQYRSKYATPHEP